MSLEIISLWHGKSLIYLCKELVVHTYCKRGGLPKISIIEGDTGIGYFR